MRDNHNLSRVPLVALVNLLLEDRVGCLVKEHYVEPFIAMKYGWSDRQPRGYFEESDCLQHDDPVVERFHKCW